MDEIHATTVEFASQYEPASVSMKSNSSQFKPKSRDSHCQAESTPISEKSVSTVAKAVDAMSNTDERPCMADLRTQTNPSEKLVDCSANFYYAAVTQEFASQSRPNCRDLHCQAEVARKSADKSVLAVAHSIDANSNTEVEPIIELLQRDVQNSIGPCMEELWTQTTLPEKLVDGLTSSNYAPVTREFASQSDSSTSNSIMLQCKPKRRDSHIQAEFARKTTEKSVLAVAQSVHGNTNTEEEPIVKVLHKELQHSISPCMEELWTQTMPSEKFVDGSSQSEPSTSNSVMIQWKPKCQDSHVQAEFERKTTEKSVLAVAQSVDGNSNTEEQVIVDVLHKELQHSIRPCMELLWTQTTPPEQLVDGSTSSNYAPVTREFASQSDSSTSNSIMSQCKPKCRDSHVQAEFARKTTENGVLAVAQSVDGNSNTEERTPEKLIDGSTSSDHVTKSQESQCTPKCRNSHCQVEAKTAQSDQTEQTLPSPVKHCACQNDVILEDKCSNTITTTTNDSATRPISQVSLDVIHTGKSNQLSVSRRVISGSMTYRPGVLL
ncbi:hypothetical protein Ciccas_010774 [Cichlidogyrus casuarinus]|uniref:Uncharacterized protein n=1 Tax=Cichlidogyrus casuarinus TaxID=1844966 RepID=A0ABD2PT95_9PLAT